VSVRPSPPPSDSRSEHPQNIATTIVEVTDRASALIREEIELAKAELTEKAGKLARGAIVGAAAGVFIATGVLFVLIGFAYLLYYYLPGNQFTFFWGFFAMAFILIVLGALAGVLAAAAVRRGTPPMPDMAIEEARKIRETVSAGSDGLAREPTASAVRAEASTAVGGREAPSTVEQSEAPTGEVPLGEVPVASEQSQAPPAAAGSDE
jgi:putative superfamily III holin-X